MKKTVLILGGNGRFGRHATDAFNALGWSVQQYDRKAGDLMQAAIGMDVIVNAWNPLYPDWATDIPAFTEHVIAAAKASRSCVIIPGNVYNFGVDAPDVYNAHTPHCATNGLGRIRIEMEQAYRKSGVQTIIVRAGDFMEEAASGNWFDMMMIPKLGKGRFICPGDPNTMHAWAWLPDVTRAAAMLADKRAELPIFNDVPFEGYSLTGNELCAAVSTAIGRPVRLKEMNWLPLQMARPFWPLAKYLLEMRYNWNKSHRLSNKVLGELLPDFMPTPMAQAMPLAIKDYINPD